MHSLLYFQILRFNIMKTFSYIILSLLFAYLLTGYVSAADCDPNNMSALDFIRSCSNGSVAVNAGWTSDTAAVKELVVKVAERALQFGGLFAVGALVWSGIKYNTSYGDDERVKSAKTTAIYAVTWLILMLVAFPFVNMMINFIYSFSS